MKQPVGVNIKCFLSMFRKYQIRQQPQIMQKKVRNKYREDDTLLEAFKSQDLKAFLHPVNIVFYSSC